MIAPFSEPITLACPTCGEPLKVSRPVAADGVAHWSAVAACFCWVKCDPDLDSLVRRALRERRAR